MRFKDRDVFSYRVPRSGASYDPTFEWEEAARWRGYKSEEFALLDGEAQSRIVAHYRAAMQLEAVITNEQRKAAGRRRKPGR